MLDGARILVVDDHDDLAENLCEIIEAEGGVAARSSTAAQALESAAVPFHVALVDIRLPDATGLSLLPRLKSAADGLGEVILVTGNASLDDAMDAVRHDAYAYILKPFDPDDLLATVTRGVERVRLRREQIDLERRTRMAEKLAAVGTLSAGLAHEIRNPLNAANLQLELLQRRLSRRGLDDDDLLEPAKLVRGEIERLSRLVEDFLSFARPSDLMRRTMDLRILVQEVAELERPDAVRAGIDLTLDLPDEPIELKVDREKLLQVLFNMLRNAMEALDGGGAVSIAVHEDGAGGHIIVSDDGPGIPDELAARLFEPFFSTKSMGTGLGMAICHSLVTQHGGEIRIESAPSGGARFDIVLPR
jgi:two-component system sensor histidine kinase HydH